MIIILLLVVFSISVGLISFAFFIDSSEKWKHIWIGCFLIIVAISTIVAAERIKIIVSESATFSKLTNELTAKEKTTNQKTDEFLSDLLFLKWCFVFVAGGIGVNLIANLITGAQINYVNVPNERLRRIESLLVSIKRLLIIVITVVVIFTIVLISIV